jgi:hypothetical protein
MSLDEEADVIGKIADFGLSQQVSPFLLFFFATNCIASLGAAKNPLSLFFFPFP